MIENDFYNDTTLHSTYCCQIITIIMSVGLLHCILRLPREIKINIIGRPRKRYITQFTDDNRDKPSCTDGYYCQCTAHCWFNAMANLGTFSHTTHEDEF